MVGSQWSGKVGCFLVFFKIPSDAGNLLSNPELQIHTIQRWSHLKTWNQSLVILDIPNFNPMKEALWYSHPLLRYSIFRDGPRLYLQKKEWYVHIVRGPCHNPSQTIVCCLAACRNPSAPRVCHMAACCNLSAPRVCHMAACRFPSPKLEGGTLLCRLDACHFPSYPIYH